MVVWFPPNSACARYVQHLGSITSHLYAICCIWEPPPRHWTLSNCICLAYQSSTYCPKPVYVLPTANLTQGLPLIVCLYATYLLPTIHIYIYTYIYIYSKGSYAYPCNPINSMLGCSIYLQKIYIYRYIYVYIRIYIYTCIYKHLHMYIHMYIYVDVQCRIYIASPLPIYSLHSTYTTYTCSIAYPYTTHCKACPYTISHTYTHTYIHTLHTYIHTCIRTYIDTYIHTCMYAYMHTYST